MNEILKKSERPECPHPGNGCWYADGEDRCANAGCVAKGLEPCRNNGWGMLPTEIVSRSDLDRETWRKEHGLCGT